MWIFMHQNVIILELLDWGKRDYTHLQLSGLVNAVDDVSVVLEVELRLSAELAAEEFGHVWGWKKVWDNLNLKNTVESKVSRLRVHIY